MPTREAMRSLGGDIISSFDLRINGIGGIKETVRTDLGEVQNFLKQLEDSRESTAKELHADLDQHTADLKEAVASELKGFEDSRTDMAEKLHADLDQHTADLKEAVASEMKGFEDSRTDMAKELHADLDQHTADLKESVASEMRSEERRVGKECTG